MIEVEIEHLKLMIAKLRRMQFGRKSEKLDHQIEQLELQLEDLQATEGEAERERPPVDKAPRNKPTRKPLPEHLPRVEHVYQPEIDACPGCGGGLRPLGEDVAEQLEWIPGSFRVIRHVRPQLACSAATPSCRHPRQAGRFHAASRGLVCWRMCWWQSLPTISRCTGNR